MNWKLGGSPSGELVRTRSARQVLGAANPTGFRLARGRRDAVFDFAFFSSLPGVSKTTQPAILTIQPSISSVPCIVLY